MSTRKQISFLLVVLLAVFLAACAQAEQALPGTGDGDTTPAATLPPEAVLNAQNWLAEQLTVAAEQVQIQEVEQAVWSDSCLELGQPNESCLAADTPGWRVVFEVNGQSYEVRTDETGSVVRLVPQG